MDCHSSSRWSCEPSSFLSGVGTCSAQASLRGFLVPVVLGVPGPRPVGCTQAVGLAVVLVAPPVSRPRGEVPRSSACPPSCASGPGSVGLHWPLGSSPIVLRGTGCVHTARTGEPPFRVPYHTWDKAGTPQSLPGPSAGPSSSWSTQCSSGTPPHHACPSSRGPLYVAWHW